MFFDTLRAIHAHLSPLELTRASGHTLIAHWSVGRDDSATDPSTGATGHSKVAIQAADTFQKDLEQSLDELCDLFPPMAHPSSWFRVNALQGPRGTIGLTFHASFLPLSTMQGRRVETLETEFNHISSLFSTMPWDDTLVLYRVNSHTLPASNPASAVGTWLIGHNVKRLEHIIKNGSDLPYADPIECALYEPQTGLNTLIDHLKGLS